MSAPLLRTLAALAVLFLFATAYATGCGPRGVDLPGVTCNPPRHFIPDGGVPPGSEDGGWVMCPDAYWAQSGRVATGMNLEGMGGNSILPLTRCEVSSSSFVVEGAGADFTNPTFQGSIQVSIGCGYAGAGQYEGDGTALRIDLTPSQYNDRYVSNAGSTCTFCVEAGGKTGWFNCRDMVPAEGGTSRLRAGGTFLCP